MLLLLSLHCLSSRKYTDGAPAFKQRCLQVMRVPCRIPCLYDYSVNELKWNLRSDIEELHFITVLHFKFYLIFDFYIIQLNSVGLDIDIKFWKVLFKDAL